MKMGDSSMHRKNQNATNLQIKKLAHNLTTKVAGIEAGETILIISREDTLALAEAIATASIHYNAAPLIMVDSDRVIREKLLELPIKQLENIPLHLLELWKNSDVVFFLRATEENPGIISKIPERKILADQLLLQKLIQSHAENKTGKVKLIYVSYPSEPQAEVFNIPFKAYWDTFWKAVNVDTKILNRKVKEISMWFRRAEKVIINDSNGTSLSACIGNCPIFREDGFPGKKNEFDKSWICQQPGGEIRFTPIPDSINGKVFVDQIYFRDQRINALEFQFINGSVYPVSSGEGFRKIHDFLNPDEGKSQIITEFGIGLNPEIKRFTGNMWYDVKSYGSVHIVFRRKNALDERNRIDLDLTLFFKDAEVLLDGEAVLKNRKFIKE